MQDFDIQLAAIPLANAYLRAAMRDVTCDRLAKSTQAEILLAERQEIQSSTDRASEICSFLTACRVMDVIYQLDHPINAIGAPSHERLQVDHSSFKVRRFLSVSRTSFTIIAGLRQICRLERRCTELSNRVQGQK